MTAIMIKMMMMIIMIITTIPAIMPVEKPPLADPVGPGPCVVGSEVVKVTLAVKVVEASK